MIDIVPSQVAVGAAVGVITSFTVIVSFVASFEEVAAAAMPVNSNCIEIARLPDTHRSF